MLPKRDTPFEAGPNDGYWHINNINGSSDYAELDMILRDFDERKLIARDEHILKVIDQLRLKYPTATIEMNIKPEKVTLNKQNYIDKYNLFAIDGGYLGEYSDSKILDRFKLYSYDTTNSNLLFKIVHYIFNKYSQLRVQIVETV